MTPFVSPDYTDLKDAPIGEWITVITSTGAYLSIRGKHCLVCLVVEPTNHNRGPFHAILEVLNSEHLNIEPSDGWEYGRYYFDIERAKAEVEAWLKAWKQLEGDDLNA